MTTTTNMKLMKGCKFLMITYQNHSFYLDGKPIIILAGEVHYFRLDPSTWESHLKLLKDSGLNTVSTYVPWLYHQELEDRLDLTGIYARELNLVGFLELAHKLGLFVFLRPGPFIMAEMKNEGIPYWIYEKHPYTIPLTWDQKRVPTPTLDYLHPSFLNEVSLWFKSLYQHIHPYLQQQGGPIIGIQLDNEVGMLSWVSNAPDLTDDVKQMIHDAGFDPALSIVTPSEVGALHLRELLGRIMRDRFKHYILKLKEMWQDLGVTQMLYFVNIHGTSHGRAKTFPIGISQLLETYHEDDVILGTDIYLGNLDLENFHDLYIVNAMMNSLYEANKPMTTLEFNTSDGNFGDNLAIRLLPSSIDFKVRMSILQNHRMLNYYLFTGGINPRFNFIKNIDGNDRIAITGERHGFAAPVQPSLKKLYTYDKLNQVTHMMKHLESKLSLMTEETDDIYLGFNPDDYMTEYTYPKSELMKSYKQNLEFHRETVVWDLVLKHLLLLHYRFKAIRLDQMIDVTKVPVLIYQTSKYMDDTLQQRLISYHQEGGTLILVGELPIYNSYKQSNTSLIDYVGASPKDILYDWNHPSLSLVSPIPIQGAHEFRTFYAQTIDTKHDSLFCTYPNKDMVGLKRERLLWITSSYPGDIKLTQAWLNELGIHQKLKLTTDEDAILFSSVQSHLKESFIHVMNLEYVDRKLKINYLGEDICEGLLLDCFAQDAYMIPLYVSFKNFTILYSTAELYHIEDHELTVRLTQVKDIIKIKSALLIKPSVDYDVTKQNDVYTVISRYHAKVKKYITIKFN
jgi:beta-galactosidase